MLKLFPQSTEYESKHVISSFYYISFYRNIESYFHLEQYRNCIMQNSIQWLPSILKLPKNNNKVVHSISYIHLWADFLIAILFMEKFSEICLGTVLKNSENYQSTAITDSKWIEQEHCGGSFAEQNLFINGNERAEQWKSPRRKDQWPDRHLTSPTIQTGSKACLSTLVAVSKPI